MQCKGQSTSSLEPNLQEAPNGDVCYAQESKNVVHPSLHVETTPRRNVAVIVESSSSSSSLAWHRWRCGHIVHLHLQPLSIFLHLRIVGWVSAPRPLTLPLLLLPLLRHLRQLLLVSMDTGHIIALHTSATTLMLGLHVLLGLGHLHLLHMECLLLL